MAIIEEVHLNDIGTNILVTVKDTDANGVTTALDISATTARSIILKKPSGTLLTKAASFVTDGTDGKIQYTTIAGDINEAGAWKLQVQVTFSASSVFKSSVESFKVFSNL